MRKGTLKQIAKGFALLIMLTVVSFKAEAQNPNIKVYFNHMPNTSVFYTIFCRYGCQAYKQREILG